MFTWTELMDSVHQCSDGETVTIESWTIGQNWNNNHFLDGRVPSGHCQLTCLCRSCTDKAMARWEWQYHVDVHLLQDQWNCSDLALFTKKNGASLAGLHWSAAHHEWANHTCSSITASAAPWLLEASPGSFYSIIAPSWMQALPHTFDQSMQQLLCALLEYGTQVGHLLAYHHCCFSLH